MIEKKEFDLGNPSDHEKLEIWLNKKDLYGTKAKKKLVPALQKSFSKFVQELVQNDSVAEYQKKLLGERIKKKLEKREDYKQKLREEMSDDYISASTKSTENLSIFDNDERDYIREQKKLRAKSIDVSKEVSLIGINEKRRNSEIQSRPGSARDITELSMEKRNTAPVGTISHERKASDEPLLQGRPSLPNSLTKYKTTQNIEDMDKETVKSPKGVFDIEPIKEKNQLLEGDEIEEKKDKFNPVRQLGLILKDIAKKSKKKDESETQSVRSGSKRGKSSKMKVKVTESDRKSKLGLKAIEEENEHPIKASFNDIKE